MNKLYLLGALALAEVYGYTTLSTGTSITDEPFVVLTYTATADCFATETATTLGLNNIYYQYYSFSMAAGSSTFASSGTTTTGAYTGCYHAHIYNWMAQPQAGTVSVTAGPVSSAMAYGYAMTGDSAAACAAPTIVTTTLWSSTGGIFTGARYNSVAATIQASGDSSSSTQNLLAYIDPSMAASVRTIAATVTTYASSSPGPAQDGVIITGSQNVWWDFLQSNVFQGQTQFGRGGGATTAPCGWWVMYIYEQPSMGQNYVDYAANAWAEKLNPSSVTVNMWTDNAMTKTLGALLFAGIAALY